MINQAKWIINFYIKCLITVPVLPVWAVIRLCGGKWTFDDCAGWIAIHNVFEIEEEENK